MYSTRKKPKLQGKKPTHRNSMIRSQVLEMIRAERIKTTPAKGRLLKQRFDRLINEAKKGTPASKRNVESYLRNEKAVAKLYNTLLDQLKGENSGYILSAKTLPRKGDNAPQAIFMLKGHEVKEKKSRLAATLERQENSGSKRGGGRIRGRNRNKVSTAAGTGKKDSTADTRRVST